MLAAAVPRQRPSSSAPGRFTPGVRPGVDPAEDRSADWTLEWLIFDVLKCDPATAHVRDLAEAKPDA